MEPRQPQRVARNEALVDVLLDGCFQPMTPGAIDRYTDSPRVRGMYAAVATAFPDATFTPIWRVVDEDRAAVGGLVRATHLGEWRGVPATGRPIEVLTTMMLELSDGGIVEMMVVTDSLTMAEQVGAVEPLGPKACQRLEPPRWAASVAEPAQGS